ncbi:MAG: DUF2142 domain-containing protein [Bifidobacterium sp.]|jgi:hypothetical protein
MPKRLSEHVFGDVYSKGFRKTVLDCVIPLCFFIVIASFQAAAFMTNTGPLTSPDPDLHAGTSYALATGQILNATRTDWDRYGNRVKAQPITGDSRYLHLIGSSNSLVASILSRPTKVDPQWSAQMSADSQPVSTVTVPTERFKNRSNQYFPLMYLPQAVGIRIGLFAGFLPHRVWQLGRLSNFAFFVVCFGIAIVMVPRGKLFLTILGCLPPVVFIASSLMSDSFVLCMSTLFVAMVLHVADQVDTSKTGVTVTLILLCLLLFLSKEVYVLAAFLVFLIPNKILPLPRKILVTAVSALIALPLFISWSLNFQGNLAIANIAVNERYVLHHPLFTLALIVHNIFILPQTVSKMDVFTQNTVIYSTIAWIVLIIAGIIGRLRRFIVQGVYLRYPFAALPIGVMILGLIFLNLLLTWNTVPHMHTGGSISGFQGRYILPILPLLLCTVCLIPKHRGKVDGIGNDQIPLPSNETLHAPSARNS